jgi:hypothetical protein
MKRIGIVIAGLLIAPAITIVAPTAQADPCEFPTPANWYDPCHAQGIPPWRQPGWTPDGKPGTWGPHGYSPCYNDAHGGCKR